MEQFCTLLWGIIGAAALAASTVVSWMLDNWPAFSSWFEPLPAALKRFVYAGFALVLAGAAWAIGRFALQCSGWPGDLDILYMIAVAVASWFAGGKRHEAAKRAEAQEKPLTTKWPVE